VWRFITVVALATQSLAALAAPEQSSQTRPAAATADAPVNLPIPPPPGAPTLAARLGQLDLLIVRYSRLTGREWESWDVAINDRELLARFEAMRRSDRRGPVWWDHADGGMARVGRSTYNAEVGTIKIPGRPYALWLTAKDRRWSLFVETDEKAARTLRSAVDAAAVLQRPAEPVITRFERLTRSRDDAAREQLPQAGATGAPRVADAPPPADPPLLPPPGAPTLAARLGPLDSLALYYSRMHNGQWESWNVLIKDRATLAGFEAMRRSDYRGGTMWTSSEAGAARTVSATYTAWFGWMKVADRPYGVIVTDVEDRWSLFLEPDGKAGHALERAVEAAALGQRPADPMITNLP
jgi:hypothetical protein